MPRTKEDLVKKASAPTVTPTQDRAVTMEDLRQQERLFRELLEIQEKNFKTYVTMFMESTNKRVDEFMVKTTRDLTNLRDSLEYSQAELEQMVGRTQGALKDMKGNEQLDVKINNLSAELREFERQIEYIDNYSRRNSLVIRGLPGSNDESWEDTEKQVRHMIKNKLKLDESNIEIERAHRTGKVSESGSRPVAIKFLRYKDKEDILSNAKKLKDTGIYINQSYSDKLNAKRTELWQEVKEHRRQGKIAYISFDRVVVKERNGHWERRDAVRGPNGGPQGEDHGNGY